MEKKVVYLSLGSNMGSKHENLLKAMRILEDTEGIWNVKMSSFYETMPVGFVEQDKFVNIAVELETSLAPYELLECTQGVEKALKRKWLFRWGPRIIDVDIIYYEGVILEDERLTIPHPRAHERGFVLLPLLELNDQLKLGNISIKSLYQKVDQEGIKKVK